MITGNVGTIHKGPKTKKEIYRNKTVAGNKMFSMKTILEQDDGKKMGLPSDPAVKLKENQMTFYETVQHVSKQLYSFTK